MVKRANPQDVVTNTLNRYYFRDYGQDDSKPGRVLTSRRTYSSVDSAKGWNKKSRLQMPQNPYSMEITTWKSGKNQSCTLYANRLFNQGPLVALYPSMNINGPDNSFVVVPPNSLVNIPLGSDLGPARTSARLKAKDMSANWAQNLAEIGQTRRMLSDTLGRFIRAGNALRHGDLNRLRKAINVRDLPRDLRKQGGRPISLDAIPNFWLELQYGWKPLLSDLYDTATAASNRVNKGQYFRVIGKASSKDKTFVTDSHVGQTGYRVEAKYSTKSQVICDFTIRSSSRAGMSRLGLTNPLDLAWELIPFSFVVDWFLPIGDFLSSFDLLGLDPIRTIETSVVDARGSCTWYPYGGSPPYVIANGVDSLTRYALQRTVSGGLPKISVPQLKNPFSLAHFENGLSLVSQAFLGHPNGGRR